MANLETLLAAEPTARLNVADRLSAAARANPDQLAVVCPRQRRGDYETITFADLDADVTQIARGLSDWGVPPGTRLALLVRPGIDFVACVFGLLRAGMVIILVDPGLGRRNLVRCLSEAEPEGFVAIRLAHLARLGLRRKFPKSRWNVLVGSRWFWGGKTLDQLRTEGPNPQSEIRNPKSADTRPDDPAAIIFTSGSTGAPKGVLYTQRMFDTQVAEIQAQYDIEAGGVDMACFPLFALFNAAMGVTTVLPDMDFSRPACADPVKLLRAANDWNATQAFASPAVWRILGEHCRKTGARIDSLRQVFSCGAPVAADVLQATLGFISNNATMHTPYGATECLPVSTVEAAEVLRETAERTRQGAGVCVGRKFDSIEWRIIQISDEPIASIEDTEELPTSAIGELIVQGPQVSPRYITRVEANGLAKIADGDGFWHRTGDVGYFDDHGRFWYCGRKSQRVETPGGILFTECVEAIFNAHAQLSRTALVGVGPRGQQEAVVVYEPISEPKNPQIADDKIASDLREIALSHNQTTNIRQFLPHTSLPVDIRHNAKINREHLAGWVAKFLATSSSQHPIRNA
jgi:acyl-CoA synthetase (AMP-forming)/AMP-acid ligase II